ncbi:MAG: ferredoxin [Candidatus Omnitrophica bacterium]|nr:ferredoxin [Candidatus Omnitrophota bacterium]MDD4012908.1 ferredoxin [Candidatus Omnitrophota bacterium]
MKAVVDGNTCIGCGLCAQIAPDVYEMSGDVAVVKMADIPEAQAADARSAAEQCPVSAISVS